jgi:hypothetical protein
MSILFRDGINNDRRLTGKRGVVKPYPAINDGYLYFVLRTNSLLRRALFYRFTAVFRVRVELGLLLNSSA